MERRRRRARWLTVIVGVELCCCVGWASRVSAQKAALGPADVETGGEDVRRQAQQALGDALRMQGFSIVQLERAKPGPEPEAPCDDACAMQLLGELSADVTARVAIAADAHSSPQSARVVLLDAQGHHFEGGAQVRDGDVRDAVARALLEARAYQLLGPGPWIDVKGTPEGADVLLDGALVGHLPYRAGIAAGHHTLLVRDAGYMRFRHELEVPTLDSHKVEIRVALEPRPLEAPAAALEPQTAPAAHTPSDGVSRTWLIAPIALEVLGVGLATLTTVRLATGIDPCVAPDAAGRCTEERGVRVWPTVGAYGLSAALIGTGVVWMVLGLSNEQPQVAANFGIDHVSVTGSF